MISAHGNLQSFVLLQEVRSLFRCALQDTFIMLKIEVSLLKIKIGQARLEFFRDLLFLTMSKDFYKDIFHGKYLDEFL